MSSREDFPVYPGWETVRVLGRGSFGAVYEIQRNLFGKLEKAALKQISIPQDQGDVEELYSTGYDEASITAHYENYLADIVKEYQLMAEMKGHTNVVYCDDIRYIQKDSGIGWDIFIKMELLTPMMKALDKVTEEKQIVKLGRDLASALVLCRSRNIIHRDIKPQNIFVSKDGDFKLGDFGIAKTAEKTSGGTKIGTYNYMAPEVYNNQPYGHSSDIYSLGLVLYWLLNERRLPFYPAPPAVPKSTEMEQARLLRFSGEELPEPLHGSEALKKIVMKACAFDPKDRYETAEEMLQDLEALGGKAAPAGQADGRPQAPAQTPAPVAEDDGTVGGFNHKTAAPAGAIHESPADTGNRRPDTVGADTLGGPQTPAPEPEEDGTVGVFDRKTAAPAGGAISRAPVEEPVPDEDGTVGVFAKSTDKFAKKPEETAAQEPPAKPVEPAKPAETTNTFVQAPAAKAPAAKSNKKKIGLIAGIVGVLAAAAVLLLVLLPGKSSGSSAQKPTATEAAHVHSWTAATCTEPETCRSCGETRGAALGHDWEPATCTQPQTCKRCGETSGSTLAHEWTAATCTEPQTCKNCGETRGAALGHTWKDATCLEPKTCKVCGATEGTSLGHDWAEATYDTPATCKRCGEQWGEIKGYIGELEGHWGDHVQVSNIGFYSWELDEPVYNCRRLWMDLFLEGNGANSYGRWYVLCRDLNGKWQKLGEITVSKDNEGKTVSYEVDLYGTFSFDALTVSPDHLGAGGGTVGMQFWAQVNVD